jgi:hypothetical protein
LNVQLDILSNKSPEKVADTSDDFIYLHRMRLNDLFSTERKEPFGEIRRPLGRRQYLIGKGAELIAFRQLHFYNSSIPYDRGKDIIEIMGHSAGELSDGLYFLGLTDLIFKLSALGHIVCRAEHSPSSLKLDDARREIHPAFLTEFGDNFEFIP